ncbi:MAG TPA: hypothetical protein VE987_10270 [Polyangiaceae bacterium]|nr:hypothetical protein [Polyangiaceae bacterium]
MRSPWLVVVFAAAPSCAGTTGYDLVTFHAAAQGPSDAVAGQPYAFDVDGAHVVLTKAVLHVGALYLTQSVPTSGGGPMSCTLPGTYAGVFVGQVRGGADVDMLDPSLQPLSVLGDGSTIPAATGQVWLTYGNVTAPSDSGPAQPILTIEGTVDTGAGSRSFSGRIWIDDSWRPNPPPSNLPGEDQICLDRIVSGIPVDFTLAEGGTLVLRLQPKGLFARVDFAGLPTTGCDPRMPADLCFVNDPTSSPSFALFTNLKVHGAIYGFEWRPTAP